MKTFSRKDKEMALLIEYDEKAADEHVLGFVDRRYFLHKSPKMSFLTVYDEKAADEYVLSFVGRLQMT